MTRDVQFTFDCADPARLAAFWAEVVGYRLQPPPEGFETWEQALDAFGIPPEERNDMSAVIHPEGTGPRLFFQRILEPGHRQHRRTERDGLRPSGVSPR